MKTELSGFQSGDLHPDVVVVTPTAPVPAPEPVPAPPPAAMPAAPIKLPEPPITRRGVGRPRKGFGRTVEDVSAAALEKEQRKEAQLGILKNLVRDLPAKLGNAAEDGYSRALMAYLASLGDPEQTARITGVDVERIRRWAAADGWNDKITALLSIKREKGQTAFAIELNRLMNLTQAVRMRGLLDEIITRIMCKEEDLADWLSVKTKDACNVTAKPLLELSRALLAVQQATYMALGDQAAERIAAGKKDKDGDEGPSEEPSLALFKSLTQLHAKMQPPALRGVEIPPARETPSET